MQIQCRRSIRSAVRPWLLAPLWLGLCLSFGGCSSGPSRATPSGVAPDRPDGGTPDPDAPDAGACAGRVDTTSDPDNCGSCGHSCGGGACVAAACQPLALAVGQDNPRALAVDATNVYWTTADGQVVAAPIAGGRTTVLASGQRSPWGIAVDADRVYWVNAVAAGKVMAVAIAGGTPAVLADAQARPMKLAVRDGLVYWTNSGNGTVMRMPVTGGTPTPLADQQGNTIAIAVDATTVYWSTIGQGAIRSLPVAADGPVATIVEDQDAVALFVRDGTVFWANIELDGDSSQVFELPARATTPIALGTSPAPYGVVTDGETIYWTDEVTGSVLKVAASGGAATAVATGQSSPLEIAIDAANLYWINAADNGAIMKLAR